MDATVSAFTSYSVVDSLLLFTIVTHTSPIRRKGAAEAETSEYRTFNIYRMMRFAFGLHDFLFKVVL